ncbi:MAG: MFS transporter [Actinomycetia bacterium]|nr:MFS transporter [Actinomycetes bacterium]
MSRPMSDHKPASGRDGRFLGYLILSAVSSLGATAVYLATAVLAATAAGDDLGEKARITSLVFSLNLVLRSLAIPYATRIARKIGTVRTICLVKIGSVSVTFIAGILLTIDEAGGSILPVLLGYGGLVGLLSGIKKPLNPPLLECYSGLSLDDATAQNRMFYGAASAVGALAGGFAIDEFGAEPLYFVGAVLAIPAVIFLALLPPRTTLPRPKTVVHPWRDMVNCLRSSRPLRSAVWLGLASAILLGPLITMIVPILNQLGHNDAKKAGLVLTIVAAGQVLTPFVVRRLQRGRASLVAATRAVQITSVALLLLSGLVFIGASDRFYLLVVCLFIFGAVFFSVSSFLYVSATRGVSGEEENEYLATYMLVTGLGAPVGTLIWGHALGSVSLEIFFLAVSIAAAIIVPGLLRRALRRANANKQADLQAAQAESRSDSR